MKKIILTSVIALTLLGSGNAIAQSNSAEYNHVLDEVVSSQTQEEALENAFKEAFQPLVAQGLIKEASLDPMAKELSEALKPKMVSLTKELWSETFTLDELKQIQQWLSTPAGKKMLGLTAKSVQISNQLIQNPDNIAQIQAIISKYMK